MKPGVAGVPLSALSRGARARVVRLADTGLALDAELGASITTRLMELGFVPGAEVEVIATLWPSGDPLAVRVRGSTFALRRREAEGVIVSETDEAA